MFLMCKDKKTLVNTGEITTIEIMEIQLDESEDEESLKTRYDIKIYFENSFTVAHYSSYNTEEEAMEELEKLAGYLNWRCKKCRLKN